MCVCVCACEATDVLEVYFYSIITWLILRHLSCYLNWVLSSFSASWNADYVCPQCCFRLEYVSHSITAGWYPVSHRVTVTLEDLMHTELLDPSTSAATTTFTLLVPSAANLVSVHFGFEATYPSQLYLLMKHMNTVFITFRVCSIQNNGWVGFLFPFCTRSSELADGTPLSSGPTLKIRKG